MSQIKYVTANVTRKDVALVMELFVFRMDLGMMSEFEFCLCLLQIFLAHLPLKLCKDCRVIPLKQKKTQHVGHQFKTEWFYDQNTSFYVLYNTCGYTLGNIQLIHSKVAQYTPIKKTKHLFTLVQHTSQPYTITQFCKVYLDYLLCFLFKIITRVALIPLFWNLGHIFLFVDNVYDVFLNSENL